MDLISRQAAIKEAEKEAQVDGAYGYMDIKSIVDMLTDLPSAEPKITHEQAIDYLHEEGWMQEHDRILTEPKKGEWIEQDDGWEGAFYECSVCNEAFTLMEGGPTDNLYNYCPNCGADMRGEA